MQLTNSSACDEYVSRAGAVLRSRGYDVRRLVRVRCARFKNIGLQQVNNGAVVRTPTVVFDEAQRARGERADPLLAQERRDHRGTVGEWAAPGWPSIPDQRQR